MFAALRLWLPIPLMLAGLTLPIDAAPQQSTTPKKVDGPWTVGMGSAQGKPLVLRLNMGGKVPDPNFSYRAVFSMTILKPEDGLPSENEMTKLNIVEDQLDNLIASKGQGRFVAVQTHSGRRKFLFYVTSEDVARKAQAALKIPASYKVELTTSKDPSWSLYSTLRSEQH